MLSFATGQVETEGPAMLGAQITPICGFDPVASEDALSLILGTFPGKKSLAVREYYADGSNAFWGIMEQALWATPGLSYEQRGKLLVQSRIALWDVLRSAQRIGSPDSAIVVLSAEPNDFRGFFRTHCKIELIFFNGEKAAALYRSVIAPHLPSEIAPQMCVLPSTSGANTHLTREKKLKAWQAMLCTRVNGDAPPWL